MRIGDSKPQTGPTTEELKARLEFLRHQKAQKAAAAPEPAAQPAAKKGQILDIRV